MNLSNFLKEKYWMIVVLLLLALFMQAIFSSSHKSLTADESGYIYSGYYYFKTHDFRLNNDHPPLVKLLFALPLIIFNYNMPILPPRYFDSTLKLHLFMNLAVATDPDTEQIVFLARLVATLLAIALGMLIFIWAKRLYGLNAGLLSLFLYCFCPDILANSGLATPDIGLAFFFFLASFCFFRYINRPDWKNLIISGVTMGLALSTKITSLLILPLSLALGIFGVLTGHKCVDGKCNRNYKLTIPGFLLSFLLILIIATVTLNAVYFFKQPFQPLGTFSFLKKYHPQLLLSPFRNLMLPLPKEYINAIFGTIRHLNQGHNAFLMQQFSRQGWWYYYLLAFVIKTTLPALILSALSLFFIKKQGKLDIRNEIFLLLPILFFFLVLSVFKSVNIGLRYILPIYPFLYIFISGLSVQRLSRKRLGRIAIVILCAWHLYSSASIYPHYLSYFNELVGGAKNGHKFLIDSNLEVGQDFKYLKDYMDNHGIKKIKLFNATGINPHFYGIDYELLREDNLKGGYIAVGVSTVMMLRAGLKATDRRNKVIDWIDSHTPIDKINYSILIYKGD